MNKFPIPIKRMQQVPFKNIKLAQCRRDFQLKFLIDQGLRPSHYVLDIGCGWQRGGIPVIDYLDEGHYHGIERQQRAIDLGNDELKQTGLTAKQPTIYHNEDITRFYIDSDYRYDYITAFYVLYHMHEETLTELFIQVRNMLMGKNGVFYANIHQDDHPRKMQHELDNEYPVYYLQFSYYEALANTLGLHVVPLGSLGELGHNSGNMKQDKQRMLKFTIL